MKQGRDLLSRLRQIKNKRARLVHSRTEQEKAPRSPNFLYICLIVIVIAAIGYLIIFSGTFRIQDYQVTGYSHPDLIKKLVEEESKESFLGNNIIFFPSGRIEDAIMGDTSVEKVIIKKKVSRTVQIEITETKPAIIWVTTGDKYLISSRGLVMRDAVEEKLPEVYDAANIKVSLGDRVASPTFINFIIVISEKFAGVTGSNISRINIFDILSDVHVISSSGWTVYFNSSKDPEVQLSNLARVLEDVKRAGVKKLGYIDMRIDTKIYYR